MPYIGFDKIVFRSVSNLEAKMVFGLCGRLVRQSELC